MNLECKPSDFIAPSQWNNVIETSPQSPLSTGEAQSSETGPAVSTWDVFRSHIPGLEDVPDDLLPSEHISIPALPTPASTVGSSRPVTSVALTTETAFLLQTYMRTIATWQDLMDFDQTYQLSIPRLALSSPLLFHCVCAFTAKYLSLYQSRRYFSWVPVAGFHYGESLKLLIEALNSPSHEHALTGTILVSAYEILDALSSERHRRHFMGAAMLIKSHGINAQSVGIDRANFWIYVRHEIGVALAIEKPLVLHPDEWNVQWKVGETREDILGNQMLWILARVINLVFGEEGATVAGRQAREAFLQELEEWRAGLSDAFIGVPYGDTDDEGLRKVYFTVTAAGKPTYIHTYRIESVAK